VSSLEDLERTALGLPVGERVRLVRSILLSLGELEPELQWQDEWATEALRRLGAFERGELSACDWQESIARARAAGDTA
jgi:putative addiction module component (TIGR02574 family)